MGAVMGIDLGTSYFKVALVSEDGVLLGLGRRAVRVQSPYPGYQELPLPQFVDLVEQTVGDAFAASGLAFGDIAAVSYSSQANTFALFDSAMQPLTPLIIWSDSRVSAVPREVQSLLADTALLEKTGMGLFSMQLCVAKLAWFRHVQPELWRATHYVMTISDLLLFLLTGCRIGDSSTASLLGIWDVNAEHYWRTGLDVLDLRPELFAALYRPAAVVGTADSEFARRLGLRRSAVAVAGSLDHLAAALGAGIGYLAPAAESSGTVLAALGLIDHFAVEQGTSVGPYASAGRFYKLAFSEHGAGVLEWYRRSYAPELTLARLTELAENVPAGCEGLTARPGAQRYRDLQGFRASRRPGQPYRHGHYARALMEQGAVVLRSLLLRALDGETPEAVVSTGGGAQNDLWLQIKADVVGCDFVRSDCAEPGSLGAAMYAACGAGWFTTVEQAARAWLSVNARVSPDPARSSDYRALLEQS